MKRRLAFLLALSLTFASFPVAGAGATETTAATDTEVVTVVEQEENSGEGVSVKGETVDPTNEVKRQQAHPEPRIARKQHRQRKRPPIQKLSLTRAPRMRILA